MRVLGVVTNPFSWRRAYSETIAGGDVKEVEMFKGWWRRGVYIETIESAVSPSLHLNAEYVVNRINIPLIGTNSATDFVNLLVWTIRFVTLLLRMRKRLDFVVTSLGISYTFHGWLASKLLGAKLVIMAQNVDAYTPHIILAYRRWRGLRTPFVTSLLRGFGDWFSSYFAKKAHIHICSNKAIAESLVYLGICRKRISISSNGVDLSLVDRAQFKGKRYDAIFVGRIEYEKGVQDLIEAWKIVTMSNKPAKLAVVGTGSFYERAKEVVANLDMEKNIDLIGWVGGVRKFELYKSSKLFIFPAKRHEWGMTVIEALACGLPAICYENPSLKSHFGNCKTVFFVQQDDVHSLAMSINAILDKKNLLQSYAVISRQYASRFDWDKVAERELKMLQGCLR